MYGTGTEILNMKVTFIHFFMEVFEYDDDMCQPQNLSVCDGAGNVEYEGNICPLHYRII